jgi:hypothetical protein
MWILVYVAMTASLSAMVMGFTLMPLESDAEPEPLQSRVRRIGPPNDRS